MLAPRSKNSFVIVLSEGLTERRAGHSGPPPVSGDGVAMAVAASLVNPVLAEVLARERVGVHLFTAVGADVGGNAIRAFCREHDVDTSLITSIPMLPDETGQLRRGGTASWAYEEHRGPANSRDLVYFNREAYDCPIDRLFRYACKQIASFRQKVTQRTVLLVSGIAASRPSNKATFARLIEEIGQARERGATIVVDPNTRLRLFKDPSDAMFRLTALFKLADYAVPSWPADIQQLGQKVFPWNTVTEAAEGLYSLGVQHVIFKLEAQGSEYFRPDGSRMAVPSIEVSNPNPAGAGDTFSGVLALGLCQGCAPEQSMRLATLAAIGKLRTKASATLGREWIPDAASVRMALRAP